MAQFQPKDFIALVALIGIGVLKWHGFDGYLDSVIALIIGYYFAHRTSGDDTGK